MSKSYIIEWKSMVNGRSGRGTKRFDEAQANNLAEELNREYPAIHHQAVEALDTPNRAPEPAYSQQTEDAPGVPELNHSPDHALSVG
jgi:hypothetical protein